MRLSFSIEEEVWVKLTSQGVATLEKRLKRAPSKIKKECSDTILHLQPSKWLRFRIRHLMYLFGPAMAEEFPLLFEGGLLSSERPAPIMEKTPSIPPGA